MNSNKCKIWDNQEQKWFVPSYPKQSGSESYQSKYQEILISQAGEIYLHEQKLKAIDADPKAKPVYVTIITHFPQGTKDEPGRFVICNYTGHRDVNGVKWYMGDILKYPNGIIGVLTFYCDRLAVGLGYDKTKKDDDQFESQHFITSLRLRDCENIGNINNPHDNTCLTMLNSCDK